MILNGEVSGNSVWRTAEESIKEVGKDLGFAGGYFDQLPDKLIRFGIHLLVALVLFIVARKLIRLICKVVDKSMKKARADEGIRHFLNSMLKLGLYSLLIIWIAAWFGFETTSLIAVLGSAGVTLALALQGSLSNITGGVLLMILKPFRIGDYIVEDSKGNEGTVVEIGLIYTKLRTIDEKIVVLPNGTLANTSLTNVSQRPLRRIILRLGIAYESDIARAKELIAQVIEKDERILQDGSAQIYVDDLEESQVTLGLRVYVKKEEFFDVKWELNERIKECFDQNGIRIPYRQLDVHLEGGAE